MNDAQSTPGSKTAASKALPTQVETRQPSRTEQAMELYLEQLEAGQCPDRESFLSQYPEIAKELAGQLEALEFLHFTAPQLTNADAAAAEQEIAGRATLGDFRLIKPIGRGGMGIVYEAEQLSLGRRVAVKVLPFAAMLDPRQLKRFQNEARAAATLEHPHIVPIHFVGQERGVHFYAMQLIEGQSLAEVVRDMRVAPNAASQLENKNPQSVDATHRSKLDPVEGLKLETDAKDNFPTAVGTNVGQGILSHLSTLNSSASRREFYRTIAKLGAQAADALQHAHQQGIIHRDIKPGNLMVDCAGKLWVTDFGLARLETNDSITAEGDLMGTLAYMSPEQLTANSVVDSRSDIYSLGATFYELLTRERPFQRRNEGSKLPTILPDQVPPPSRFDRNIPLDLQTIVLKAMSVEPNDRYPTASAMADDLRSFVAGLTIRARPPSYSERAIRLATRHPRLLTSFGLACIMLTGVLGLSTLLVWRANQQSRDLLSSVREHSDRVEELLYLSDMQLAYQAWESRKLSSARGILGQQVPGTEDENDYRGIEWHLLDALTAAPPHKLIGQHSGSANQLAVFPDGKRLASVGEDRRLRIWNLATGEALTNISMGNSSVEALFSVAISPDGKIIATGSDVVQLWDVESNKLIRRLTSFDYNVQSIAFAPDGRRIAVGSRYDRVRLLDLAGNVLGEMEDESRHESLVFTPDGNELLIPSREDNPHAINGLISIWQSDLSVVRGRLPAETTDNHPNYTFANVSADGSFFVLCSRYGKEPPCIVDARTREVLLYLREKHDEVNALDISPDGRTVAIAFNNGTIECTQLERTEDGQFQLSEETWTLAAHSGKVKSIKFAGPTELVSCGADGQIKSWQLTDARPLCIGRSETYGLAISPASNEIAFADDQGWNLMNPTDGSKRSQGHFPYAAGSLIAFSRDGRFLAGITSDNRVAVYRQDDGEILQEFTASGRPTDVQFSPVANELATISANILNVWDLETMSSIAELQLYPSATGPESNCGYTTDGKFILAAGTFGELLVIDAFSFTIVRRIPIASNTNAIAFSPAGDILATAHDDGGIRIWDWPRGMIRATLIGHTQKVRRIAFSSDGRTLASIAFDKTTRLWAPKIGRYYGILHHHFAIPTDLAFATNGTFLAVTQERSKSTGGGLLIFPTTSDPSDIKF